MHAIDQESKPGGIAQAARGRTGGGHLFNPLRHYAIWSLVSILVAAVMLTAYCHNLEVHETTESARKGNLALAEAVLDSIRPEIDVYLGSVSALGPGAILNAPFPLPLATDIRKLMAKTSIAKIRIYNSRGVVVFSTDRREVGSVESGDAGYAAAKGGQAASLVSFRDGFSVFDQPSGEDNLARTFLPVRAGPDDTVRGVLSTYVDLTPAVAQYTRELFAIVGGMALILALLYSVLLLLVVQAKREIDIQQKTVRERTSLLETLSVQLIADQETERARLATNLHDGLAQTLTAAKKQIEYSLERMPADVAYTGTLNTSLSALQGAIDEVQELATELRPAALDELGLIPTLRWYCREFEYLHPGIQIEQQFSVPEHEIPAELKIAIYRIIEAVMKDVGENVYRDRIRLSLQPNGKAIVLAVDDIPLKPASIDTVFGTEYRNLKLRFAAAQERTTLSGGNFSAEHNREGGVSLHASWAT